MKTTYIFHIEKYIQIQIVVKIEKNKIRMGIFEKKILFSKMVPVRH